MKEIVADGACVFCGQYVIDGEPCDCPQAIAERGKLSAIADV
jgi:hypothetical protein